MITLHGKTRKKRACNPTFGKYITATPPTPPHLVPAWFFPECVARVPVSLCGSGGWGCVRWTLRLCSQPFATVRNRPQPSATVRNRPRDCYMAVPMVSSAEVVIFCRFQTSCCFISRGKRGTLWHSDVFCNASKMVLCGRRNTFATFSEDALQFSWQAQHFGRVHRHFAWQAQHFRRVVLRVFFANRIGRAASSGDKVQMAFEDRFFSCMAVAVAGWPGGRVAVAGWPWPGGRGCGRGDGGSGCGRLAGWPGGRMAGWPDGRVGGWAGVAGWPWPWPDGRMAGWPVGRLAGISGWVAVGGEERI